MPGGLWPRAPDPTKGGPVTDFLPPAVFKLGADISELVRKLTEAGAAIDAFAASVPGRLATVDNSEVGAEGERVGRSIVDGVERGTDDVGKRVGQNVSSRLRNERGRVEAEGENTGRSLLSGIGKALTGGLGGIGKTLGASLGPAMVTGIAAAAGGVSQLLAGLTPAVGAVAFLPAAVIGAVSALTALKLAVSGVGAAMSAGLSGQTQQYAEALKKLAPAAQQAVKALVALKPQLDGLKQAVQQNFFAGLARDITSLAGTYLPLLRTELGDIAAGFNRVIGSIAQWASAPATVKQIAAGLHDLSTAVTNVAAAFPGILHALTTIGTVASQFLPGLTSGLAAMADKFAAWIDKIAGNGVLTSFIQDALTALSQLGGLLQSVGSIVNSLFWAMGAAGGQALGVLAQLVDTIAQFLKSTDGMQFLTTLFGLLGQVANTVGAALTQILPVLGQVLTGLLSGMQPLLGLISAVGGALVQVLPSLGQLLSAVMTGLGPIITLLTGQFLPVVVQLAQTLATALVPVINALAPALNDVLSALMPLIAALGGALGQVLVGLAPVLAQLATSLGQVLVSALQAILPLIIQLLPVFAQLAVAILPDLIPLIRIFADLLLIQAPLIAIIARLLADSLGPALRLLVPVFNALVGPLTWVADKMDRLVTTAQQAGSWLTKLLTDVKNWQAVGQFFTKLWNDIVAAWDRGIAFLQSVPGRIVAGLQALPGMLSNLANRAFDAFFTAVGYGIGSILKELMALPGQVVGILSDMWNGAVNLFNAGLSAISGIASSVWSTVTSWFSQTRDSAVSAASSLYTGVVNWFSQLPGRAEAEVSKLPGQVMSAVSGAANWLYQTGRDIITGLINGIKSMITSAIDTVKRGLSDVVSGAKKALGINSPSTVFAEIGGHVVSGFVAGVNRDAGDAARAVADMLSFAPGSGLSGLGTGPGGVPGGGTGPAAGSGALTVTLNNQLTLLIDGKQLHAALIGPAQRYKLRTGTTGLT